MIWSAEIYTPPPKKMKFWLSHLLTCGSKTDCYTAWDQKTNKVTKRLKQKNRRNDETMTWLIGLLWNLILISTGRHTGFSEHRYKSLTTSEMTDHGQKAVSRPELTRQYQQSLVDPRNSMSVHLSRACYSMFDDRYAVAKFSKSGV